MDIRLTIFGKTVLIHEDVHNFRYDIVSFLRLIDLMLDTAFESHREIRKHRSIYVL